MTLDLNKPVQLSDGRKARIICTDRVTFAQEFPVIALVTSEDDEFEYAFAFSKEGELK